MPRSAGLGSEAQYLFQENGNFENGATANSVGLLWPPRAQLGSATQVKEDETRTRYLGAIRAADNGDIQPLLKFARS